MKELKKKTVSFKKIHNCVFQAAHMFCMFAMNVLRIYSNLKRDLGEKSYF